MDIKNKFWIYCLFVLIPILGCDKKRYLQGSPPGAFQLTSPANGVSNLAITARLVWSSSSDAQNYTVEVATESGFINIIHRAVLTGGNRDYTIPDKVLSLNTTYYWRVTGTNDLGQTSATNQPWAFSTSVGAPSPPVFNLTTPADGSPGLSTRPQFTWTDTSGEDNYTFQIASDNGFNNLIYQTTLSANVSTFQMVPAILTSNNTYYWRVLANRTSGQTPSGNGPFFFDTKQPGAFALSSPANGATLVGSTPTLAWTASAGVRDYTLYLSTDSGFTNIIRTATLGKTAISYPVVQFIVWPNTTYYWRVTAANSNGQTPANGGPFSFTTDDFPGAFDLSSPVQQAKSVSVTPTFTWTDCPNETSYTFQIDDETTFSAPLVHEKTGLVAGTLNYTVPTGLLTTEKTYYWRVVAINAKGQMPAKNSPFQLGTDFWTNQYLLTPADDFVRATALDSGSNLYIAGDFTTIDGQSITRVAKWNGSSFSALGSGISGRVYALAVDQATGTVYAGGDFTTAGGIGANRIAMWDGAKWAPLGTGLDEVVYALAIDSGGKVYAGGRFTTAGGTSASCLAMWTGTQWTSVGGGVFMTSPGVILEVRSLCLDGTDLYVGGRFNQAGTKWMANVAMWNGATWSNLGGGLFYRISRRGFEDIYIGTVVHAIGVKGNKIYFGGEFFNRTATGVSPNNIACWDKSTSTWSALSSGANGYVYSLDLDGSGNLYIGGAFSSPASRVAQWNGSSWSGLGTGLNGAVYSLVKDKTGANLYLGGEFDTAGGTSANHLAQWNGTTWSAVSTLTGNSLNNTIQALATSGTDVYVGGDFLTAGSLSANRIGRWNGTAWSALGTGMNGTVSALAFDGTGGNLYAGGGFTSPATRVAIWNGSAWSGLGTGMNNVVSALAWDGTGGNLYAGGIFTTAGGVSANRIAMWNGSAWSGLGSGFDNGQVYALAMDGSGNLYAGGSFSSVGGTTVNGVAIWNGSTWSAVGSGTVGVSGTVRALVIDGANLYVGGDFTSAGGVAVNRVALWNGSAWSGLASGVNGTVYSLGVNGGNLFVGGMLTVAGGASAQYMALWNGSSWSGLGSGLDGPVNSLGISGTNLYVGGQFSLAGNNPSYYFARWDLRGK